MHQCPTVCGTICSMFIKLVSPNPDLLHVSICSLIANHLSEGVADHTHAQAHATGAGVMVHFLRERRLVWHLLPSTCSRVERTLMNIHQQPILLIRKDTFCHHHHWLDSLGWLGAHSRDRYCAAQSNTGNVLQMHTVPCVARRRCPNYINSSHFSQFRACSFLGGNNL